MATFDELSKHYAVDLQKSYSKRVTAEKVVRDIKNLVYTGSNTPLSRHDQQQIAEGVFEKLGILSHGQVRKDADNKEFLELAVYVLSQFESK